MTLDRLFRWTWDTPRSWQDELDRLFPRSSAWSWLKLTWMPGDLWEPVQRWVIYQMTPRKYAPSVFIEDLEGPNPRSIGHYDTVLKEFQSDSLITLAQWQLYQQYQCYASPLWIIQGSNGGHKRRFDIPEQSLLEMRGLPTEAPAPGDLPYANFDGRVTSQLLMWDRLRKLDRWMNDAERADAWRQERYEGEMSFRVAMDKWLDEQIKGAVDAIAGTFDVSDLPMGDTHYNRDEDAVDEAFFHGTSNPV